MIEIYKSPDSDTIAIVRYTDDSEDPDDIHVLWAHSAELEEVGALPVGRWLKVEVPK